MTRLHGLGPMGGTDLDAVLRNLGVSTVVGVGVSVNVAITNFAPTAVLMRMGFSSLEPAPPDAPLPAALYGSVSDNYFRVLGVYPAADHAAP